MTQITVDRTAFENLGFMGPISIFTPTECRAVVHRFDQQPTPPDWSKGNAVSSRLFFEWATSPKILDPLETLLGPDLMLWGAVLVRRPAGKAHPWHADIESSGSAGRTVAVWIGLQDTTASSSLKLLPYTHRFGQTIQELAQARGLTRDDLSDECAEDLARCIDPRSEAIQPDMGDGDAIFFDGRLWHGTHNLNARGVRIALLLQYATPDTAIRIPDREVLEWPFRFLSEPRPPCLMVRGKDSSACNRIVSPPLPADIPVGGTSAWVHPFTLPLAEDRQTGWKRYPAFRGGTNAAELLSCHVSVLSPGAVPHPLHEHPEEELLVVLEGQLDVLLSSPNETAGGSVTRLSPESFVYYAAGQRHTVRNTSEAPVTYLVFKWQGATRNAHRPLPTAFYDAVFAPAQETDLRTVRARSIFQGETAYLSGLRCHTTTLDPGAGYPAHADAYDVAIILLQGQLETLGKHLQPHTVAFCPAGERHGMRNGGSTQARYLVFEFHPATDLHRAGSRRLAGKRRPALLRLLRRTPIIWRLVPSGRRS